MTLADDLAGFLAAREAMDRMPIPLDEWKVAFDAFVDLSAQFIEAHGAELALAVENSTALVAENARLRAALEGLLSYPGPVSMTEDSHPGCREDECYVAAARAALRGPS